MGTAIVITSGKGGTGKSSLTVGVGACLAAMGKQVLCIDMDIGLRNLDLSLGMSDMVLMDVIDVLQQRCPLDSAAVHHPTLEGLSLLPAPVTLSHPLVPEQTMKALMDEVRQKYDYCLIDCPAGVGSGFDLAVCAADQAIVVASTDPVTIRAAQAAVSRLRRRGIAAKLVINRITRRFLRKMNTNVDDAMDALGLPLIGIIPDDPNVTISASRGVPVIMTEKRGAARAYYNIAKRITGQQVPPMRI